MTVRELLDRGERDLERKLDSQPQLKMVLDGVLAEFFDKLGTEKKALPLAEERRDLALKWAGPDSLDYGDALYVLAQIEGDLGHNEVAEQTYRQATAVLRHHAKQREGEPLLIERMRAHKLNELHREKEARELLLAALPKLEAHFGATSWEVALTKARLATTYTAEGDHPHAAQIYDSLETVMANPPSDHVIEAATLRQNQSYSLWRAGRLEAAEQSSRKALAELDRVLGTDSSLSIIAQRLLGVVLMDEGKFAEASAAFDASGARAVRHSGTHDPEAAMNQFERHATTVLYQAGAQMALGRFDAAATLAEQAGALFARDPDATVPFAKSELTEALARAHLGDTHHAGVALAAALANLSRKLKPDHPNFLLAQLVQAEVMSIAGRSAETDHVASEARGKLEELTGASLPRTMPVIF